MVGRARGKHCEVSCMPYYDHFNTDNFRKLHQETKYFMNVLHPDTPPKAALHLLYRFVPDRGASTKGEHAASILHLLCSARQRWARVMDLEMACLRASSSPFWRYAGFHCIAFHVGKAVVFHRSCRPTLWLLKLSRGALDYLLMCEQKPFEFGKFFIPFFFNFQFILYSLVWL